VEVAEQRGGVGEGLVHPRGALDGRAVAGEEQLGLEGRHRSAGRAPDRAGYRCTFWGLPQLGEAQMKRSPVHTARCRGYSQVWSSVSPRA
jgi:hypothetical protein